MTAPKLSFDKPGMGRYYAHPVRRSEVPSITNIKDAKGISALKYWAAKQAGRYAADNIAKLATLEPEEIFTLVKGAPFAKTSESQTASAIGDIVHGWIDRSINGTPIPAVELERPFKLVWENGNEKPYCLEGKAIHTARNMWRQWNGLAKFYTEQHGLRFVASEFTVWSERYGYAGTADWAAYINGALVLGDTKTGNRAYRDTAMQLAALANADFIIEPNGHERPMPKFEKFAVAHVRPTFARLIPYYHIDIAFKEFLGCKEIFDAEHSLTDDQVLGWAPKIQTRVGDV